LLRWSSIVIQNERRISIHQQRKTCCQRNNITNRV